MAVKINNISYSGFFYNGEALTAMYLNGNKVYGSEPQPITITPVEWVSNENLSTRIWLDLGYVWKNNSRAQLGFVIPGTHQKPNGQQVFGEDTVWASDGNGPVDDNNDLRLFFTKSSTNIGAYWDVATSRVQATIGAITDVWQDWEIGNNYIKNLSDNTNFVTGSTYSISRTGTVGLYGACQYLNTGRTDCVRYSYVKIYEGDTLVKDIIPVLDNNNIPCFFDKITFQFYYYKVNGVPSTGLTAGNPAYTSDYIEGDGSDYIDINYVPVANTYIEMDNETDSILSCGSYDNSRYGLYWQRETGTGYWRYSNGAYQVAYTSLPSTRYTVKFGKQYYIDGEQKGSISNSWVGISLSTTVFGIHRPSSVTERTGGKLYRLKIYEGDTLKKDLLPYKQSGVVGLYDRISKVFYPSNSNTMTQGGNIQPVVEKVMDITISNETPSTAISAGNTFNLNASTTPSGATLSYSSSDTSIATVDSNGVVTAVSKGAVTITITAQGFQDDENKVYYKTTSKAVSVECAYPTQQITITKDTPSEALGIEETFDLNVSTTPTGATVTYSSSDTSVATVSNQGVITAVATGSTTITIEAEGFDDDVNHITYTSASTTVSITVAEEEVETYDFAYGDGNDYIITDYAPNSNSVIEVKFKNKGSYGDLIGFSNNSEQFRFVDENGYVRVYGGNDSVSTQSSGGVIKQNGSSVEVDGNVIGSTSYITNTDNLPLYIFASNYMNRGENYPYLGRIYYVKVWENNTLVHEWVGATKGNKVGMYDTVTSVFTASQNNDLTVGNEVLPENSKYFLIKSAPSRGVPYVSFSKKGTPSGSLYYRVLGDAAWTEVTGDTSVNLENSGEIGYVELKGSIHNTEDNQWQIGGSAIEPQHYLAAIARNEEITSSNNSIAGTYAKFYNLFNGNYELTNITNIIFPTDTDPACYKGMFINCTEITTAPILPATSLRSECYKEMFKGCFQLNTVPSAMLPATTLVEDCYYGMFENCWIMTTGPDLPAPSTTQGCYYAMFQGCNRLTELKVSFTNTPGSHINYWLNKIYSTGTLYAPSNASYSASDLQLPSNWTLSKTLSS